MTPDELLRTLPKEDPAPIYFLFGGERFYQVEIIRALTDKLITPDNRDFNLETFEAKSSSVEDWLAAANTFSFLGGRKLVIVRNLHEVSLTPEAAQSLLAYLKKPCPDACLALTSDKVDRKKKLDKALTGLKTSVECSVPQEGALASWLKQRADGMGYSLPLNAARMVVDRIGPKPGVLASELEKLATYAGEKRQISETMVSELVGSLKLENVFQLTDALKSKNVGEAFRLLHNQLHYGEEPLKIFGMIAWQFRMIWEIRHYLQKKMTPGLIAREMGVKPFVVEKALKYANGFSHPALRSSFDQLLQADRELKTSGKDPERVLESLIIQLCSTG